MSYGVDGYKTKKALREAVDGLGADEVAVFGTSIFGNETATTVAELGPSDVIVGPDVYNRRSWYATFDGKRIK